MRVVLALAVALIVVGCAGSTSTAVEYRDLVAERSAAYAQEAEQLRADHLYRLERAVDGLVKDLEGEMLVSSVLAETSRRSASLFAAAADAVERYATDLAALDPPDALRPAHLELIAALESSISGLGVTLEALAAASTFDEIDAAIGGSTFNDAQYRVDAACRNLEEALAAADVPADLRCREA